jgi:hypothetical protein
VERKRHPGLLVSAAAAPDFAKLVVGPRFARTRWLNPGYMAADAIALSTP